MGKVITPRDIVPDVEIERVHANANFGNQTKRSVVNSGVVKFGGGWTCGYMQRQILIEHGLIRPTKSQHSYRGILTPKGHRYLRAILRDIAPVFETVTHA